MKKSLACLVVLMLALSFSGCGTGYRSARARDRARQFEAHYHPAATRFPAELEDRLLALDAERVSAQDVREVLARVPAPRVINIHGGIYPVYLCMESFSEFLIGMGYPAASITNPATGEYSFSCYDDSAKIAGAIAWYYEREGLRPVIVGHSQGGMQAVKVLYQLAGRTSLALPVWNPLSGQTETRTAITDPLSGQPRAVTNLQVAFTSAVGSGGFTRFMPNQWDMFGRLREIPDSTVEFTGYSLPFDLFGGDLLGFGAANNFKPNGTAIVRNVRLPFGENHVVVPATKHLLKSAEMKAWIDAYVPADPPPEPPRFKGDSSHILWAADTWFTLKKHWVLELQRRIRAQRAQLHGA